MVKSVSQINSHAHFDVLQKSRAEQDPGWRVGLSMIEINELLKDQEPFSYILSSLAPNTYLLSFVSSDDQSIVHIQFDRLEDGRWHYVNGQDNIMPTLKGIIRKMMHLTDTMYDPTPSIR